MEKPRKRKNRSNSKESISPAADSTTDKPRHPKTSSHDSASEEREFLEVKHVVLILVMVFALFFIGTFLFLNAVESKRVIDDRHHLMTGTPPMTFQESRDNTEAHLQARNGPSRDGKKSKTSELEELHLPTILWWTDMLYPHGFSGEPVTEIKCDVGTCLSTKRKEYLPDKNTRGILFYGTDFRAYEAPLPREIWHEWALLHEESPMNNYILSSAVLMRLFNHTGTFRRESHFPITTNALPSLAFLTERKPVALATKNKLRRESHFLAPIAYIQSHCDVASDRDRYVKELMKHIEIDSYGTCLNNKQLPPHLRDPVESMFSEEFYDFIAKYKFHLAFENAICEDYITEKFFRPFHLGSVPIHMGSATARDWAPGSPSLIMVDDFESSKDLADFIKALDANDTEYEKYLQFKKTGVQNPLLVETMKSRNWGVNEYRRHSFITGFECHVCDKIYDRWDLERRNEAGGPSVELPEPRVGAYKHLGCPVPSVSIGKIEDAKYDDDVHTWVHDYWSMQDQAFALDKMIREGYTDTTKLFDVLEEMHRESRG